MVLLRIPLLFFLFFFVDVVLWHGSSVGAIRIWKRNDYNSDVFKMQEKEPKEKKKDLFVPLERER